MAARRHFARAALCPVLMLALSVAACGKRGSLERPGPLWGEPASSETKTGTEIETQEGGGRPNDDPAAADGR